jgi:hypothetical protein
MNPCGEKAVLRLGNACEVSIHEHPAALDRWARRPPHSPDEQVSAPKYQSGSPNLSARDRDY